MIAFTWIMAVTGGADKSSHLLRNVLPWLILLACFVIAGGVLIYFVRRWISRDSTSAAGFTLQDLREMHARGELSDEQFHAAKATMIGRLKGSGHPSAVGDLPEHDQKPNAGR